MTESTADQDLTTVITTHVNADFDAVACMVAAQRLYPSATLVFPGSHEKTLRNFFVQSVMYLFNTRDIRDVDFDGIQRLVLVDTRQRSRIGRFAEIVDRPDLEIHVYDHHPAFENDIRGHYEVVRKTGAAITILVEMLKEKGIAITPDEATIMCMGLYEDTGAFTFSSTTEWDLLAGAHLLSQGARLDMVAGITSRELTFEQVRLLNELLQNVVKHHIGGVEVAVSCVGTDDYVPEFAVLVHKMVRMENLNAFFAVARMGNRVYVVGRSQTSDVDASLVIREMGGGGHAAAASATLKDQPLAQVERQLLELLRRHVRTTSGRDLMSSPAIRVDAETPLSKARARMIRYNVNALLVTEKGEDGERLIGYISRQILSKAISLRLGEVPVREYTSTEMGTVGPDSDLSEIQEKIIGNKQRIIPVMDGDRIIGVVTRTDLLNVLVQQSDFKGRDPGPGDPYREEVHARTRDIHVILRERLSKEFLDLLSLAGQVADGLKMGAYAVGGFVRDLFLNRRNEDMDIAIEGDGIAFARIYAKELGARLHTHEKFGTAVVILPGGFKIDVVTARMEYYLFPADLPHVEMGSIKLDMYRRDFTINTLAIQLNGERFGTLIDFFSAQKDIKEKVIRILHNLSFAEDPTRAFRAIRFEQRFGFTIGKLTATLLRNAVRNGFLSRLSGRRTFNELRLIMEEEDPSPAIRRLGDFDLLALIHPDLRFTPRMENDMAELKKVLDWYDLSFLKEAYQRWVPYFMVLTRQFDEDTLLALCRRFEIASRHHGVLIQERIAADQHLFWLFRHLPLENAPLYRHLKGIRAEVLLYMMAVTRHEPSRKAISHYFTQLRQITTSVKGEDLKRMGIPAGPLYGEILTALLDARLNGGLETREEELAFARNYLDALFPEGK